MTEKQNGNSIKVLIVDDQEIISTGLKLFLEKEDFVVCGEARNGNEALTLARASSPDIILMDINMPLMDGIEATKKILSELPDTRIIIFTTFNNDESIFGSFAAGAHGYCMKDISPTQLKYAIHAVKSGASWLDGKVADRVLRYSEQLKKNTVEKKSLQISGSQNKFQLTEREIDVLKLLVEGCSNKEISARLIVSTETVKTHMQHIFDKLRVADRTQAALKTLKEGILDS